MVIFVLSLIITTVVFIGTLVIDIDGFEQSKKIKYITFGCAVTISIIVYALICFGCICTSDNDYLAFEGTVIACTASLLGVTITLEREHKDNIERMKRERVENELKRKHEEELFWKKALIEAKPILEFKLDSILVDEKKKKQIQSSIVRFTWKKETIVFKIEFSVTCLYNKPVKNIYISSIKSDPKLETHFSRKWTPYVVVDQSKVLYSEYYELPKIMKEKVMDEMGNPIKLDFVIHYMDIYENEYTQKVSCLLLLECDMNDTSDFAIYKAVVNNSDMPKLISKKQNKVDSFEY